MSLHIDNFFYIVYIANYDFILKVHRIMKKIMIRSIFATLIISIVVLACSGNLLPFNKHFVYEDSKKLQFNDKGYINTKDFVFKKNEDNSINYYGKNSAYGAYLAGRLAHIRHDYDNAAEYYKIVLNKDQSNTDVNRTIYILLALLGQIDEAAPYARKEIKKSPQEPVASLVVAISDFAAENYKQAREDLHPSDVKIYEKLIIPLFNAWAYAGEHNEKEAIASIEKILDEPALATLKKFHTALIYDYLGNSEKAGPIYKDIIENHQQNVTYRVLEVITDFYARKGDKTSAYKIYHHFTDKGLMAVLLKNIESKIASVDTTSTPIINTPQKGLSEALFNIGTIYRSSAAAPEAQIYIAMASYLNPEYDVYILALANILEDMGLLKEANKYYSQINKESSSYYVAKVKMVENYNTLEDYNSAVKLLRQLLQEYPDDAQLYSDLGNIYNNMNQDEKAIEAYNKALQNMKEIDYDSWPVYFALAISYDKLEQPEKAETYLLTALDLSKRDANVLNHLGYSWLTRDKNTDKAAEMILEAYKSYPYEGHIIDSLGWVYFRSGQYDKAVEFLEQASAINPGNAVISDHLGDAYWFAGRKNEAVFQWMHALDLKEDAELLDKEQIQAKIDDGKVSNKVIRIINPELLKELNDLSQQTEEK